MCAAWLEYRYGLWLQKMHWFESEATKRGWASILFSVSKWHYWSGNCFFYLKWMLMAYKLIDSSFDRQCINDASNKLNRPMNYQKILVKPNLKLWSWVHSLCGFSSFLWFIYFISTKLEVKIKVPFDSFLSSMCWALLQTSLHGSCPVIAGEKWVATKWIRDEQQDD